MTLEAALMWTSILVAVPAAIAALELLLVRASWNESGVFRWSTLRRDLASAPRPLRVVTDLVFDTRGFTVLLVLQLLLATRLPWASHPLVPWLLVATQLAISWRFRGTYNGGSDSMLVVVLLGLALARSLPQSPLESIGLAYIAAQLVLSYFVAGVGKLRDASWRNGSSLAAVAGLPHYGAPHWAKRVLATGRAAPVISWAIIFFECASPVSLTSLTAATSFAAVALAFHAMNAMVLGLNRFWWTWLAAYPALLHWAAVP